MKKTIFAIVMMALVCMSHMAVTADSTSGSVAEAASPAVTVPVPEVYTLSLSQAIDMAKASSPVLECCDINKENIRVQLKSARITMKNTKDTPVYASSNYDLVFVKQGYYVKMFEAQYELADYEKSRSESTIAYDVTQKYYNCKNAVTMCDSAKSALDRARENEEIVKKRLSLGMCTQIDADVVTLTVKQCEANLEKCVRNAEIARQALRIAIGVSDNAIVNLTDEITVTTFNANPDVDIQNAMNTRYDVKALKISAELAKEYFRIAGALDDENTTYYSAYANNIKTEFDYSTGVKNISLAIRSSYNSAVDAIKQAELAGQRFELMKAEYETFKIRNEIGMITNLTLSSKADELTECENNYNNALLAQKLAIEKYNYDITTGI